MDKTAHPGWFSEHRGWEDITFAVFGGLILLSPGVSEVSTTVAVNAGVVGVVIAALALLELMALQRWEEIMELACGAWIAGSPWIFTYEGDLRMVHVVLGGAVCALALFELWQDRNRKFDR